MTGDTIEAETAGHIKVICVKGNEALGFFERILEGLQGPPVLGRSSTPATQTSKKTVSFGPCM